MRIIFKKIYSHRYAPFFYLSFCLCILHLGQESLEANKHQGKIQTWFEYAYEIEALVPNGALEMYQWILDSSWAKQKENRSSDIVHISTWRLLDLYRTQGHHLKAAFLLQNLTAQTQRVRKRKRIKKLFTEVMLRLQSNWKLKPGVLQPLKRALQQKSPQEINYFTTAIKRDPSNHILYNRILALLFTNKAYAQVGRILADLLSVSPTLDQQNYYMLGYAALQLRQKKIRSTINLLQTLHVQEKSSLKIRERYYYLMGRAYRDKKDYKQAIRSFQLAFSASRLTSQKDRMETLMAYCHYLMDQPQLAIQLLGKEKPKVRSINKYILWLVLRINKAQSKAKGHKSIVDLQAKRKLQRELRRHRPYLMAKSQNTSSILARKALLLIHADK